MTVAVRVARLVAALAIVVPVGQTAFAEIVDQVVAVVGSTAITRSEVDQELRLAALLNVSEVDQSPEARRRALRRHVERQLISQDLELAGFLLAQPAEIDTQMQTIRALRFLGGRDFPSALRYYGLTEAQCREFITAQINFERYVSFRFKTGLHAEDAEIAAYYNEVYRPAQSAAGITPQTQDRIADTIREILIERQADRLLDERIKELEALSDVRILVAEGGETLP